MTAVATWIAAARPRTLPAAVVPVGGRHRVRARAPAASRGARRSRRSPARSRSRSAPTSRTTCSTPRRAPTPPSASGPLRAVAAGLISAARDEARDDRRVRGRGGVRRLPRRRRAAGRSSRSASPRSLAGIAYTGGPWPLGYHGLGDVFVIAFFGFVAVCGTAFVQVGHVPALAWWAAVPGRRARDRDPRRQQPARSRRPTPAPASARSRSASAARVALVEYALLLLAGLRGPGGPRADRAAVVRARP